MPSPYSSLSRSSQSNPQQAVQPARREVSDAEHRVRMGDDQIRRLLENQACGLGSRSTVRHRRQTLSASKPPPERFRGFLADAGTEPGPAAFRRTLNVNRLKPPRAVTRPALVERTLLGTVPDGDHPHIVARG